MRNPLQQRPAPRRAALRLLLALAVATPAAAQLPNPLPLKYSGPPTVSDITAGDLMTRLYLYADDSLMGRQVGTEWNDRATAYIEREVRRLGLQPAGTNGYFQDVPVGSRVLDAASVIKVGNRELKPFDDFIATSGVGGTRSLRNADVVFGGMLYDTLNIPTDGAWKGKVVVFSTFVPGEGFNPRTFTRSEGYRRFMAAVREALAAPVAIPEIPEPARRAAREGGNPSLLRTTGDSVIQLNVTTGAAEALMGRSLTGLRPGTRGERVDMTIVFRDQLRGGARNVVAIVPGSDPVLKNEYVAIGGHNDHVGFTRQPVDHDSIYAYNHIVRVQGADSPNRPATPEESARMRAMIDSLRGAHTPRVDSIRNGADDDGSGSMGLLEIAEAFAAMPVKPRRSIILVWHTGEEAGLWGADHFTEHPTVPREAIVAQLNIDMIGRGAPEDVTGEAKSGGLLHGDLRYLQVVGSRRLSTELGDVVDDINGTRPFSFRLDYAMDANGHPQNIYCRSDHYMYARFGIPVVFFTTGGHADYHQVTDEPQYIRYEHFAEVVRFVGEIGVRVANADARPVVDKPVPDRNAGCRQ